jgi:hypothetical protein
MSILIRDIQNRSFVIQNRSFVIQNRSFVIFSEKKALTVGVRERGYFILLYITFCLWFFGAI